MQVPFLDLHAQYEQIKPEIDQALARCIESMRFIQGPEVRAFEQEFALWCETSHCATCANGTDALEIALRALGIGPGDEVIVPALSFIATSEAVSHTGAQVVFCDISPDTYTIDSESVLRHITPHTRAVVAVHLYGQMCDMERLEALSSAYGIFLVEDCAQAHGATWKGKKAGSWGHLSAFSFFPGKNLGAYGDAGAITTQSAVWHNWAARFANHGRAEKYTHDFEGRNSRLDSIQAAVLRVKLRYIDGWNTARRNVARFYMSELADIEQLILPTIATFADPVWHLFVVRVPADVRDAFRQFLAQAGIETGIHYPVALPLLGAYADKGYTSCEYPVAVSVSQEAVSLPIFPEITSEQMSAVVTQVRRFFSCG